MLKMLGLLVCLGLFFGPATAVCDDWPDPQPETFLSDNGSYAAVVTPAEEDRKARLEVFDYRTAEVTALWVTELTNDSRPVTAMVTDDGTAVVTLDNWFGVGQGPDVVAFYLQNGQIRQYGLVDIVGMMVGENFFIEKEGTYGKMADPANRLMAIRELFPFSVSSAMWLDTGKVLIHKIADKWVFCIWASWAGRWTGLDMATGGWTTLEPEEVEQIIAQVREDARAVLNSREGAWTWAIEYLGWLANKDDRKVMKDLLFDKEFFMSATSGETGLIHFSGESYSRSRGDYWLSVWDGKETESRELDRAYQYLGMVAGTIKLATKPADRTGNIWVYLLPAGKKMTQGEKNIATAHRAAAELEVMGLPGPDSVDFEIRGVTPGSYRIEVVWDRVDAETSVWDGIPPKPGKGDFLVTTETPVEVKAGETTKAGLLKPTPFNAK